ncbi:hypothetical protein [Chryseobacterium polytrichastri]|uniref:Uncharacterized protein n=1 Tax=Chryseobacterium polytrichastri TaxID=1302687 RepID=A0A1M6VUU3_9FLAO|nr:hypothetical protein [Chryseobacterium polytrichastri]SHK85178.1 hypothetical protein SAMN05444267_1008148 [Chryseobacterium polytrichastri]
MTSKTEPQNLCTKSILRTTGTSCPISGIWESTGNFRTTCPVAKGSQMPKYFGKIIQWKLIQVG